MMHLEPDEYDEYWTTMNGGDKPIKPPKSDEEMALAALRWAQIRYTIGKD